MKEGRKPEYPQKTPGDELQKMPHTKPEGSSPKRDSNPRNSGIESITHRLPSALRQFPFYLKTPLKRSERPIRAPPPCIKACFHILLWKHLEHPSTCPWGSENSRSLNPKTRAQRNREPEYFQQFRGRYHGGRRPSSDDSFHSPTIISPSALDKPSIMKRYHRRRTCSHTSPRRLPMMVTLHDTRFVECRWWNDGRTEKTVVT